MQPSDLITLDDIAEMAGATLPTVRTWKTRYPDSFPRPWWAGKRGELHLYLRSDVEAWLRETGRAR